MYALGNEKITSSVASLLANVLTFLVVAVGTIVFYVVDVPSVDRGFYCDDDSIRYPYKDNTVTTTLLFLLTLLPAMILLVVTEVTYLVRRSPVVDSVAFSYNPQSEAELGEGTKDKRSLCKIMLVRLGLQTMLLLFGFGLTVDVTFMFKACAGRLRPHFLAVCQAEPCSYNCSDGYVETIVCTQSDTKLMKDARRSFLSGHASQAFYFLVFLAVYLEYVVPRRLSLPKAVLQVTSVTLAAWICVTRIQDNMHHPSDVVAGGLLGTFIGYLTAKFTVSQVPHQVKEESEYPPLEQVKIK